VKHTEVLLSDYQSIERVLLLLRRLSFTPESGEAGYTRSEVYEAIPLYSTVSFAARRRMFERDLGCIEKCGFTVMRRRRYQDEALYRVYL
jgi:hypothetical protein